MPCAPRYKARSWAVPFRQERRCPKCRLRKCSMSRAPLPGPQSSNWYTSECLGDYVTRPPVFLFSMRLTYADLYLSRGVIECAVAHLLAERGEVPSGAAEALDRFRAAINGDKIA